MALRRIDDGYRLELNAHPEDSIPSTSTAKRPRLRGVIISINSDAHSVQGVGVLRYGVGQARRGWLDEGDVLNTRPLKKLRTLLARTM